MSDAVDHEIMAVSVGPEEPATGIPVDLLRSGLESDDPSVNLHAANVASFVPREEAATIAAVVPQLRDCLEADRHVLAHQSATALAVLADEDPAAAADAVPELVSTIHRDHSPSQATAAMALGRIALDSPSYLADHVEALVDAALSRSEAAVDAQAAEDVHLDEGAQMALSEIEHGETTRRTLVRETGANLLVDLADYDHELIAPYFEDLLSLLEEDNVALRTSGADIVANVAQADRSVATPAVEPLRANLEHDDETVVANAVTALGFVGHPDAVDPLRAVADDESRSEDLRDLAAETAEFIDAAQ